MDEKKKKKTFDELTVLLRGQNGKNPGSRASVYTSKRKSSIALLLLLAQMADGSRKLRLFFRLFTTPQLI